uniref:hypothetical protein n=1 Tax=Heyndrickxia sporothermodurans TaxID=46224 RepID=UPI0036D41449
MVNTSSNNKNPYGKLIRLLEEQLAHSNQQNKDLSKKLDQSTKQIEALTEQIRHLTKLLYGSKSENRNTTYQMGKAHYLMMTRLLANLSTQKNKANRQSLILLYEKLNQKTK